MQHQHALEIMEAMTHPSPGPICLPLLGVQQPFMASVGDHSSYYVAAESSRQLLTRDHMRWGWRMHLA